jgi:hypothetical protein
MINSEFTSFYLSFLIYPLFLCIGKNEMNAVHKYFISFSYFYFYYKNR